MNNFSRSQTVRKPVSVSATGVVASQHVQASRIGAAVLREGGDAVDAAVAVSFALGVLEPWMSGPAGGGAMILWREKEQQYYCINYGMRSPAALNTADFALSGAGISNDLFPWKSVIEDRNVQGAKSIAVPGTVAGIAKAHEHFGSMPWSELLQPAIQQAKQGLTVDWYAALLIASATRALAADKDAAALFLEDGQWPTVAAWTALSEKRIDTSKIGDTLSELATQGAQTFYTGDVAAAMCKDIQDKGGYLAMNDLAQYTVALEASLAIPYRNSVFHASPTLTAGPTLADTLRQLEQQHSPTVAPDKAFYSAFADSVNDAFTTRLTQMGDQDAPHAPSCTTHFSIVDRHGNMVSMTQTLLSIFGSRVVSPSTGLLMNNGIMWFDPESGHPNSLAPNKRCLMNVCPVIAEQGNKRFAVGASGGRKIMTAVALLGSYLTDYNMSLEEAFHHPRIDVSGGNSIVADDRLSDDVLNALKSVMNVTTTKHTAFPLAFACPSAVFRENGLNSGCTEIMSPWADAVAE